MANKANLLAAVGLAGGLVACAQAPGQQAGPAQPISKETCQQMGQTPQTCAPLATHAQLTAAFAQGGTAIVREECMVQQQGRTPRQAAAACAQFPTSMSVRASFELGTQVQQYQAQQAQAAQAQQDRCRDQVIQNGILGALGGAGLTGLITGSARAAVAGGAVTAAGAGLATSMNCNNPGGYPQGVPMQPQGGYPGAPVPVYPAPGGPVMLQQPRIHSCGNDSWGRPVACPGQYDGNRWVQPAPQQFMMPSPAYRGW